VSLSKVLIFIDLSATKVGISPEFSFYLLSITNAGSGLGRVCCGILADKFGALTVISPLTLLCAIMTYVWPFVTTKGSFIGIGIIYGFCSGAYVSLFAAPPMIMGDMDDARRRSGTALTFVALGAIVGPPISGAIAQATGGFRAVSHYAGTVFGRPPLLDYLLNAHSYFSSSGSCILGGFCVPISREIPDDRQFTRKSLTLRSNW